VEIVMSDQGAANGVGGRLNGADTAQLSQQIAGLTRAGLPLGAGLTALSEELPRGALRRSMHELAQTLEAGFPLDKAIEIQGGRIPAHLRGLVIAGIRSGNLGDFLSRFSGYFGIGIEVRRRLWLNLAYPIVTVCAAMALFVLVSAILISQFESIYKDFGIPLPQLTLAMIAISHVVNTVWVPAAILLGVVFFTWLAARLFLNAPLRRSLAARLPIVGAVWRTTSLAEFCHLLALLLESHLPLPEALRLTGEGVQDAELDDSCRIMADEVESGRSLAQAMSEKRLFPSGLPNLLRWAERDTSLPEVLHMAGAMFEARARSSSTFTGTVVSVLCVLLVLGMVMVVPGLFLPLITLISRLSG
jgi:type II secretory pathway component PulF